MASRLARTASGVTRLRPSVPARRLPALATHITPTRHASNVPAEDPKEKAQSILDALPGSSLVSKTAILSAGTGLSIWAISTELYVFNEESIVALCTLSVVYGIIKYGGPAYKEWADTNIKKIKDVLYAAKADHANSVKARIEDVKLLSNVVDITKQLFEVSKETAKLEAQAFELEQRTALAAEAKTVLDSWVRYEGQVKARQQKELADTIIAKIGKELENPKVLQQVLQQSIAEVERAVSSKAQ